MRIALFKNFQNLHHYKTIKNKNSVRDVYVKVHISIKLQQLTSQHNFRNLMLD